MPEDDPLPSRIIGCAYPGADGLGAGYLGKVTVDEFRKTEDANSSADDGLQRKSQQKDIEPVMNGDEQ